VEIEGKCCEFSSARTNTPDQDGVADAALLGFALLSFVLLLLWLGALCRSRKVIKGGYSRAFP
jgi:hypothetical protein